MQNQTNVDWLVDLGSDQLGTGLFLIPDVRVNVFGAAFKHLIPDITYTDCIMRGAFVIAVKWVPHTIADFQTLQGTGCGRRCVATCVEPGCICNPYRGQCE